MESELEDEHQKLIGSVSPGLQEYLTPLAKDFAFYNAIAFKGDGYTNIHVPFTLFPSPFPKHLFERSKTLQLYINSLIDGLSSSKTIIMECLQEASECDSFTRSLLDIYNKSLVSGFPQIARATILRTDYMVDDYRQSTGFFGLKQVEINTISSSFMSHATDMNHLHKHNLKILFYMKKKYKEYQDFISRIPNNDAVTGVAKCIETCFNTYCKYTKKNHSSFSSTTPCILFIIHKGERNTFDQLKIKYKLMELLEKANKSPQKEIGKIYFISMAELHDQTRISLENGELWYNSKIDGDTETPVSVVYYRTAYCPEQYPSDKEWQARLRAEMSIAIKIPNIAGQLVGTKKVQQVISEKGVLESFLRDGEAENVRETFAELYSLGRENLCLDKIIENAISNPELYVMKPQREGGGNNLYGKDMVEKLREFKKCNSPLSQFILMSLIKPTIYKNYLVSSDHMFATPKNCVSELGVFGTFVITNNNKIILNESCGHLIRTKSVEHQDGGVYSGIALLDTPYLF